jgi:hypothetical protein
MKLIYFYYFISLICLVSCQTSNSTKPNENQVLQNERWVTIWKVLDSQMADLMLRNEAIFESLIDKTSDSLQFKKILAIRNAVKRVNKQIGFTKFFVYSNIGGELDSSQYSVKKPWEIIKTQEYMLGTKDKKGEAYVILEELINFDDFVRQNFSSVFPRGYLPLANFQFKPIDKNTNEAQRNEWIKYKFTNTTVPEAMAMMYELQIRVLAYENQILNSFKAN